jgi:hypothetical protein
MVKLFHGFSKPLNKFVRDMVYGIQATGDTILTDIARAIDSQDKHRNVENRLSRNLKAESLAQDLQAAVMDDARRFFDKNTLVIIDPTDVCKPHALKMEHLTLVRDASRSTKENVVKTRGYHGCMAVACKSGSRKTVPLALKLWSSNATEHKGENEEVLDILRAIDKATDGMGIRVYDRGGDRPAFYDYYLDNNRKFITRMNERDLVSWKRPKSNTWLASQCIMYHKAVVSFDSHGKETRRKIDFGVMPVRLPWRDEELRLVVVKGFGQKPMMLLTNLAVNEKLQKEGKDGTDHSYKALWQVVEGYLSRWRIEETIRFVKQCYGFENIRVMSYASWRNMSALVLVATYFTAAWLGREVRKGVLVSHIERMHQRFNDVPEFFLYALAEGIRRAFSRYGIWVTKAVTKVKPSTDDQPDLPGWDDLAFLGAG